MQRAVTYLSMTYRKGRHCCWLVRQARLSPDQRSQSSGLFSGLGLWWHQHKKDQGQWRQRTLYCMCWEVSGWQSWWLYERESAEREPIWTWPMDCSSGESSSWMLTDPCNSKLSRSYSTILNGKLSSQRKVGISVYVDCITGIGMCLSRPI